MNRSVGGLFGLLLVPALLAWGCTSSVDASDEDGDNGACGDPPPPSGGECGPSWACIDGEWVDTAGDCPSVCPVARPADGTPCPQEGLQCPYWVEDEPCGEPQHEEHVLCGSAGWTTLGPRCSPPYECPLEMPVAGSECSQELPYSCTYSVATQCGEVVADAACDIGTYTWVVNIPEPCGPCDAFQDSDTCSAVDGCRWLEPGCGEPPLPQAGCFPVQDCAPDTCDEGQACTQAIIDPCWNSTCEACGAEAYVCLATDG